MSILAYKLIFIIIGFISLILSIIGVVIPILPTTPFLLLSTFCFFKGSKKLDLWFKNTALYKNHVDVFIEDKEMDIKSKVSTIATLTILFSIGFFFAKELILVRIILATIWMLHILYFTFYIKTRK